MFLIFKTDMDGLDDSSSSMYSVPAKKKQTLLAPTRARRQSENKSREMVELEMEVPLLLSRKFRKVLGLVNVVSVKYQFSFVLI